MPSPYYNAGNVQILTGTSPAAPGTVAGTAANTLLLSGMARFDAISIEATLQGATGGTLDVFLQVSCEYNEINPLETVNGAIGGNWTDYVHWTPLAAGAASVTTRVSPSLSNVITTVGLNLVPLLAAGTCVGGFWGHAMRLLFVAGAGTSLGATQTVKIVGKMRNVRP